MAESKIFSLTLLYIFFVQYLIFPKLSSSTEDQIYHALLSAPNSLISALVIKKRQSKV